MSKPVFFIGSSKEDIKSFPEEVRKEIGFSLHVAENGGRAINTVPLTGFGNSMVPEIIVDCDSDTYRAVYTVQLKNAVYVLHAFMKKSKKGRETPKQDIQLVKRRLKAAEEHHREMFGRKIKRA